MKCIIVTGGVLSGLGKGITSSSIGCVLRARGVNVTAMKIDPYLNSDAGTLNPFEHGEVFVLDDGGEADLDLGNYERFMDASLTSDHVMTTGKVYGNVIEKERDGHFLGKTVQIIPHITNEIKSMISNVGIKSGAEVVIVELGGTVGDIESMPFLEAMRQMHSEMGHENILFVHTTLVPTLGSLKEQKTKPTQHSVRELRGLGIQPDVIVARCERPLEDSARKKIALFCDVPLEAVVSAPDAKSIYQVPIFLDEQGLPDYLMKRMNINVPKDGLKEWKKFLNKVMNPKHEVKIALVGKYMDQYDSYMSHYEALAHAGAELDTKVTFIRLEAEDIEKDNPKKFLDDADGVLIPGGFGSRGAEGKIEAIKHARMNKVPFLGVCLGFQLATVEFSRNVLQMHDANSTEFDSHTSHPVIDILPEQKNVTRMGATMRLGAQAIVIEKGSKAEKMYGSNEISERHRHRYEVNPHYIDRIQESGLKYTGRSPDGKRMEIFELDGHPFFMGSQFHPEFKSRPQKPAHMHFGLVKAALEFSKKRKM
ncbi:MAG: CTP synthase (glutamine hydrolyzing) [Candidatus Thermoplasmatota archaeon]|nr:CTP synthase (glutamine hydrolyzing) [Candidatus Thermoplasmatota archaeon]